MKHLSHTLCLSISLSLLALPACKSKDAGAEGDAKTDADAKAGAAKAGEPATGGNAALAAGSVTPPGGRSASDNLAPLVELVAGLEACKLSAEGGLDGECAGFDEFYDAVSAQEDDKAVSRTLVNFLGDQNEVVRWAASDRLGSLDLQSYPALLAMALAALATETNEEISRNIAGSFGVLEDSVLANPSVQAGLTAALVKVEDDEAFDHLLPPSSACTTEACWGLLVAAVKQNPSLRNRAEAAYALYDVEGMHPEACAAGIELITVLSKEAPAAEDAKFDPHEWASSTLYELAHFESGEGDAVKTCAAVLPGLIDEAIAQAKAGTLHESVFYAVLELDQREDKKDFMAKLITLAETVAAGAKFNDEMKQTANGALADYKAEG
ncbi:hypothetical protein G6O69_16125 [Pseudenhygromyxa sp. WMMC2535]|uniref:hypothetical protein n=1 Tax=Pseudenhygromyxa sp. WMMC2535 TaxID=2712867 RepID=UPI001557A92D|nr:hypothetical protein [Pseudenhygromyxa sp. WMMC2535]NVB39370.1 hypothetical protein [Pseudenhygromyxa sp. WMMC2535]